MNAKSDLECENLTKSDVDAELRETLESLGHPREVVDRIVRHLSAYDRQTIRASVFDSIERGSFDLNAIIQAALTETSDENPNPSD